MTDSANPGCVHFEWKTSSNTDQYTNAPTSAQQQWFQTHMDRIMGYTPYWDSRLSWFPASWFYQDSSNMYAGSLIATQHPEWILKDQSKVNLYLNWGCGNGSCPQYAPDYSNENFRQWWIAQAQQHMSAGYRGIFIDDVNLVMNLSNGMGQDTPIDNNTGQPMTAQAWEQYLAGFLTEVRAAFPNVDICHNALWYAGNFSPKNDQYVAQEVKAANYINLERGFADFGLTGDGTSWSIQNMFAYIDAVHALGVNVLPEQYGFDGEFSLASYFLINGGADLFANDSITPNNWPSMYDVSLGSALGARRTWNGLIRRDFSGGMVLINPPGQPTVTVTLPGNFTDLSGNPITSITLSGRQGAILLGTVVASGPLPDGTYTATNLNSQLVLDDASQSLAAGNQMIQWTATGHTNQNWNFSWNGSGYYTIQNRLSGLYLTSGSSQGSALTQQGFSNNSAQLWSLKASGTNYLIVNKATGFAIDDPAYNKNAGTVMDCWPANWGANQIWTLH